MTDPLLDQAAAFAALGDPTRLALVVALGESGPQSLVRLAAGTTISRQAVSRHLQVLASVGLVTGTKHGREQVWAVVPDRLAEVADVLRRSATTWR